MTDFTLSGLRTSENSTAEIVRRSLKRRYSAERRFKLYGLAAVCLALAFLAILLGSILANGYSAFVQTKIRLDVFLDESVIDPKGTRQEKTLRQHCLAWDCLRPGPAAEVASFCCRLPPPPQRLPTAAGAASRPLGPSPQPAREAAQHGESSHCNSHAITGTQFTRAHTC